MQLSGVGHTCKPTMRYNRLRYKMYNVRWKLTGSQLSLPHQNKQKIHEKRTKKWRIYTTSTKRHGRLYVGAGGADSLLPPSQIEKLGDHSDVISEVPKCPKIQIFRGFTPNPAGGAYSAPQIPQLMGKVLATPLSRTPPPLSTLRVLFLRVSWLQITKFATLQMIDFKYRPIWSSYFFPVSDNGENGLGHESADGGNDPWISGLEPPLQNE